MSAPLLAAKDIRRVYEVRRGPFRQRARVHAVDGVSFTVEAARTLAVVGESGCGKSTLARVVTMLEPPSSGSIVIDGKSVTDAGKAERQALRRSVQMVFQDPYGSLNPRKTIGAILEEPLAINTACGSAERREQALAMMAQVGLRPEQIDRYPHMFSGGQRQRVAIARALMLRPRIVVADEPVSALDVSIRAQVLNLLLDLQEAFHVAYLFISHDLSVVRYIADDVMVMYLGRAVERGSKAAVFARPRHPYTRALLAATPGLKNESPARSEPVRGEPPSPLAPPSGCHYHTRCPHATEPCRSVAPALRELGGVLVACHNAEQIA